MTDEPKKPDDPEEKKWGTLKALGWLVVAGVALFGALYALIVVSNAVQSQTRPVVDDGHGWWIVGVCVLVVGVLFLIYRASDDFSGSELWTDRATWLRRSILLVGIPCSFIGFGVLNDMQTAKDLVDDYCRYGSKSQAQLDGCKSHVTRTDVENRDTQAAKFAKGIDDNCYEEDSGPFCLDVSNERAAEAAKVFPTDP